VSLSFGVGHNDNQLLAVGCGDGQLMIYKVPISFRSPGMKKLSRCGNSSSNSVRSFCRPREIEGPCGRGAAERGKCKEYWEGGLRGESSGRGSLDEDKVDIE
jgi:hypothetical protein